jgi:lanthanide-dependent methanol dehydrogenase
VAEKYDPMVNWASHIDMKTGRPKLVKEFSPEAGGEDHNTTNICPASVGSKDEQPAAFSPKAGLFFVPTNHVCMDYEPFRVSYTAGQPYVGSTVSMHSPSLASSPWIGACSGISKIAAYLVHIELPGDSHIGVHQ